jgi:hypothetical protein
MKTAQSILAELANEIEALQLIASRAEAALGILAEWYARDTSPKRMRAAVEDDIECRAYAEAIKREVAS